MDNMTALVQAMSALRPGEPMYYNSGEPIDASKIVYESNCSHITQSELDTKIAELQTAHDAQAYARNRQAEYPPIGEQLDLQYWDKVNGTSKWQESISKVKSDHPKPTE